jgi:predicted Rdx family selenoprotein
VDALKTQLNIHPTVIKGSGGIFTIAVNGIVVSAKEKGVFPTEDEIVQKVKEALHQ